MQERKNSEIYEKRSLADKEHSQTRSETIRPKDIVFYILLMVLIMATLIWLIAYVDTKSNVALETSIVDKEARVLSAESKLFSTSFDEAVSDLLYLRVRVMKEEILDDVMGETFTSFMKTHLHYDQLRFIGTDGIERVRVVNTASDGVARIPESDLQDKHTRQYFIRTRELVDGSVYVSALNLNIENDVVEVPYNPVIRFATPIYEDGNLAGILVINYKLNDLLTLFEQFSEGTDSDLYLLNDDGYYLVSPDSEQTWGNSVSERAELTFQRSDPLAWVAMLKNDSGQVQTDSGGYIFQALTQEDVASESTVLHTVPQVVYGPGRLMMVSFISSASDIGYLFTDDRVVLLVRVIKRYKWFLIFAMLVMLSFLPFLLNRRFSRAKIKRYSEIDALTGVYNRRKGFDLLESILSEYDEQLSICFIDVNGLKVVNDTLGHEAGDKLLKTSAELLKQKIRNEDVLCRFGGDEFVIGFVGTTPQEAEVIWSRILDGVNSFNQTMETSFVISLSHGVSGVSELSQVNLEALIHLADERMYREKAVIKRSLQVVRREATDYII
jgi:diguanylate cyclase (GGDEF)-like protein